MTPAKKIYFASDFHLGVPDHAASLEREKKIVRWLDSISEDAESIYLMGDIFDFWFEYKDVVPQGYVRLLGKLAELSDKGISIRQFVGNHDMWMFGYFEKELGIPVYKHPQTVEHFGKKFYLAHGDGLGPGDLGYKLIKKVFRNKFCQRLFGFVHPRIGIGLASFFSGKSRTSQTEEQWLGEENEWLVHFAREHQKSDPVDYFIFGHRHIPRLFSLEEGVSFVNLGDWISHFTYAVHDGEKLELLHFNS